jgi:C-terminal binding protein
MPTARAIIADFQHGSNDVEQEILKDVATVESLDVHNESEMWGRIEDADCIMVYHTLKVTKATIERLTKCKLIVRCGVGYDNVDHAFARTRGIPVANVPDYGTEEVADHALMLLIAIARRFLPANQAVRAGNWDPQVAFGAPRLRGRTLGVIGCGRIGGAMVLRAKAIGMRVVIFDPYKPDGLEKALGVERCHRLEDLLAQSEFVSLHCPLTTETRHLLNAQTLAQLPKGAYVVNTARGPCIDPNGLLQALESGQVAYAALDVVEVEPLDDERIRNHPRIVLTPHSAFYSVEGFQEMRSKGATEARRMVSGEKVRNPVNLHCLVHARCRVS